MTFQSNPHRPDQDRLALTEASVGKLFRESEIEAEYTIGWVRIAVGLALFVGGFLVSSGTTALTDEHLLHQAYFSALITVGAFLALGIASLLLVIRHWFRPWMAFVLVAGDAAILGASLFFGLEGSGLSGNWVAAMPTVWAVPLVLAVGALRYQPVVQVWATVAMTIAVVGAASALGFRPFLTGLDAPAFTRDLEASVGRLFSLPPYLMRAVTLALIGLTTALVMVRSRRVLARAVSETARRANLARFLPAEIAPLVLKNDDASWRKGRRQEATILFVDIRGSTAYAEKMDPARLSVFISSFRRRVMHAAAEHGGVVDKFIGDGALLIFGVPEPRSDDSARAVECARELLALLDRWSAKRGFDPPLRVGIGIHAGEVYCGLVGDDRRIEFTVLGDVVNVAAKLEQATKRFNVTLLASEVAVTQAGERAVWQEVGHERLGARGESLAILAPL